MALPYAKIAKAGLKLAPALINLFGKDVSLDTDKYYKTLMQWKNKSLADSRRTEREMGSQLGSKFASRGLNDSPLAAHLTQANQNRIRNQTLDNIRNTELNFDVNLADAENRVDASNTIRKRNALANLFGTASSEFFPEEEGKVSQEQAAMLLNSYMQQGLKPPQWLLNQLEGKEESTNASMLAHLFGVPGNEKPMHDVNAVAPHGQNPITTSNPHVTMGWGSAKEQRVGEYPKNLDTEFIRGTEPVQPVSLNFPDNPKMAKVESMLGEHLTQYLTAYLGDDYSDIFEWDV